MSKSDGRTQRSKRQREKLNILDAGLKTCHFAKADYSIKLSLSYSPRGGMECYSFCLCIIKVNLAVLVYDLDCTVLDLWVMAKAVPYTLN